VTDHQLLVLLVQVSVLVATARFGGEIAVRLGIPPVVGELVAGMCLGPSLLGVFWADGFRSLFPADPAQRALLDVFAWIGVIFLVLVAGLDTRLGILRRAGKAVVLGWLGGFLLPFASGLLLGFAIPEHFIGPNAERPIFALFWGTALSISAIPVIARILADVGLLKSRVGMVILSTAVSDDTLGWIILGAVAGLTKGRQFDAVTLVRTLALTVAFVLVALSAGRWLVETILRAAARLKAPQAQASIMLVLVFASGALTQAIGVHLVLGAFIAGILVGRVGQRDRAADAAVRNLGTSFFVPLFFAYTGAKVDLNALTADAWAVAAVAFTVACLSKMVGAGAGAYFGGLPGWEAMAVGAGCNARGAMELIIAAIGLSLGILTPVTYAIVVLIAVLTSLMAAPLLRYCMSRAERAPAVAPASVERALGGPEA
jgi:Kef-type K+ transport system membrane component KefB